MSALLRRLRFLTQSLRRHGLAHVVEVFRQESVRRRYGRSPIPEPTRAELMAVHGATDPAAFIEAFVRSAPRRLPLSLRARKEFFVGLLERSQGYDSILEDAERFSEGQFLALGISTLEPDGAYDWHRDYGSGKVWPKDPFNAIRFGTGDGSDVKYPWELSRFYWIAWLGKAYWISGNGVWTRELVRQIDAWREGNPANVGVNWAMPMEVGIRGFWLAMGFGLFHGAPGTTDEWWLDYLRLAWSHGAYLEHNLEYFSNLTNHYIANCFGLVAIGALFADSSQGRKWLLEGRRRLEKEIEHQVLDDGAHYERSLPYHRLVLEMYLIALVQLERAGEPFTETTRSAIGRMAELLVDVMLPDGTIPQIGDADDGVILRTTQDGDPYDARDVAAMAAVIFGRREFRGAAGTLTQGAIMMLGGAGYEAFEKLKSGATLESRLYRSGGFAILRSPRMSVVADVGVIGLHGNNDTLSFTLADERGAVVVDPGTYCYTRNERLRNELRSSRAHNGPCVDAREIAEFDGLWRIRREIAPPRIDAWMSSSEGAELAASHNAYDWLGWSVTRRWSLRGEELRVADELGGASTRTVTVNFTLHPAIEARAISDRAITLFRDGVAIGELESSEPLRLRRGWFSPGYGVAASTTIVGLEKALTPPGRIEYIWRLSTPRTP
jgi:hypothetical protein